LHPCGVYHIGRTIRFMGFRDAQRRLVEALRGGRYGFEERGALEEKNLLAIGEVDAAFVMRLLQRCPGTQYRENPHDFDATTTVHTFLPELDGERWYVKAYFLSDDAVFISVHISGR
jgi:hypothetical protein